MTYEDWIEEWLMHYVQPSKKMRTYERYMQICKLHIIPHLGNYELSELTAIDLQKWVTYLLNYGNLNTGRRLSANFVNLIISVLQSSLKTAYLIVLFHCQNNFCHC